MDRELMYDLLWAGAGLIFILNGIESLITNELTGFWYFINVFEIFIGTSLWTLRFIGLEEKRDWVPISLDLPWWTYILINLVIVLSLVVFLGGI